MGGVLPVDNGALIFVSEWVRLSVLCPVVNQDISVIVCVDIIRRQVDE